MNADKVEGLLYTILSEKSFKNQRINTTEENLIIPYLIMFISILACYLIKQ